MQNLRIGISTQTPLFRFESKTVEVAAAPEDSELITSSYREGVDYKPSPGGVCRMILPAVRQWVESGWIEEAHWFSLQPLGPRNLSYDGLPLHIHHMDLPKDELAAYARTKEKLWADIHGLQAPPFDVEDFRFYARYNWHTADSLLKHVTDIDLAYVHDFQLLQMGGLIGLAAPAVLRWHVPFNPRLIPRQTRHFLLRAMEDFDLTIVSTRRDLEGLLEAGFHGVARQRYPYIDLEDWPDVSAKDTQELENAWGLHADDPLILCVGRMDPIKRHDIALQALARLRRRHPNARLVFIGNGSFSGSSNGGLGIPKAKHWRDKLEGLVEQLRLKDNVRFAHWVPDKFLAAAYARANAVLLPSDLEGFGLTILEGWRYGTPGIASTGAGAAEVIQDGLNGFTFPPGDADRLAELLARVMTDSEENERMGAASRSSLSNYVVKHGAAAEVEVLEEALRRFGDDG